MSAGHWDRVYGARPEGARSWTEMRPGASLRLLEGAGIGPGTRVLDVGGGASRLVGHLLNRGCRVGVLDVSSVALDEARERLAPEVREEVEWIHGSVLDYRATEPWDVWHDRASFHFLTLPEERRRYRLALAAALAPGGTAVIATFRLDGPERCSGLPVQRYDAESLAAELGAEFVLEHSAETIHVTPAGVRQPLVYARLRRVPG